MLKDIVPLPVCQINDSCSNSMCDIIPNNCITLNNLNLISATIKQARKAQKLSKEDLASSVYLKLSAFKKWEKDPSLMPVYILLELLDTLNIKLSLETEVDI
jgi:DNA-binding transcriptional regulator YiaG